MTEYTDYNGNTVKYGYDELGNMISLTYSGGEIVRYSYYRNGWLKSVTDAKGRVTHVYGEILSGDTTLTRYLYNGRCGVSTDENGLYYMRQRYYNPEIKRFINQDILTGSIGNSQSLNRYSYVQGNPVSYSDPFGLSPMSGLFTGTRFVHGVLGSIGCILGSVGIAASLVDAAVYCFVDKDYGMAALSLISAVTMSVAVSPSLRPWETGWHIRGALYIETAGKLISNMASFAKIYLYFYYLTYTVERLYNYIIEK